MHVILFVLFIWACYVVLGYELLAKIVLGLMLVPLLLMAPFVAYEQYHFYQVKHIPNVFDQFDKEVTK